MQLIDLQRGRTRVTIAPEAGGRILQIEVRHRDAWLPLLVVPDDRREPFRDPLAGGCYVMAPWPGRVEGGRFLFEGRQYAVPIVGGEAHALHGRALYRPWTVDSSSDHRCVLSFDFDDAWPFGGRVFHTITVRDSAVEMRIEIQATKPGRFPAGAGWHPWFRRDVIVGHDVRVRVEADRVYEAVDLIPTGWLPRVRGEIDLHLMPHLRDRRLDTCYRQPRSLAIAWDRLGLRMESSPNVDHAVVYTPGHAVCVEPQTCAPDAFNLAAQGIDGCGMAIVTPSRPLVAETTWRWRWLDDRLGANQ